MLSSDRGPSCKTEKPLLYFLLQKLDLQTLCEDDDEHSR